MNDRDKGGLNIGSLKVLNIFLLGKWWWHFKAGPDGLRKEVIKSLYGLIVGLGENILAYRKSSVWGAISGLSKDLHKVGLQIDNLFWYDNLVGKWRWFLEDEGEYSICSLRKAINDCILDNAPTNTIWFKVVPQKLVYLFGVLDCTGYPPLTT